MRDFRGWQRPLFLILILFILFAGVHTYVIPPFEGPDEAQHYAYIRWLAEGKGFPPQGDAAWDTPIEQEGGQPPLYYLLASVPARLIDLDAPTAVYQVNPHFTGPFPRDFPDNDNRAIHYPNDAWPLKGGWLALFIARWLTLSFGVLLLISVNGILRQLLPNQPQLVWLGTFMVAVTPQIVFISSVASNDIPSAALSTLALWLFIRLLNGEAATTRRMVSIGVILGLAGLAKVSALALVAPVGAGLLWLWRSHRWSLAAALRAGVAFSAGLLVSAGWWFGRAWWLYGTPLGLESHDKTPWAIRDPSEVAHFMDRWLEVGRSYWMTYGWGTIRPHGWVYNVLLFFGLLALTGLLVAWWRRKWPRRISQMAPILLVLLAGVLAQAVFLEVWMHRVIAPYGRLLYSTISIITLFLIIGWHQIHPKLPHMAVTFIAFLSLSGFFFVMLPAYNRPPPLTAKEIEALPPSLNLYFGSTAEQPVAELISGTVAPHVTKAGKMLQVDVCWRTIAPTDTEYTILVHIIGPNNALITNRRTYPGLGRYPSTLWQPGDVFCDPIRMPTWDSFTETRLFKVEVALLDEKSQSRLNIYDGQGSPVAVAFTDNVKIISPFSPEPVAVSAANGAIQLLEHTIAQPVWEAGQTHHFTLQWGVASKVEQDYQLFVHLRDPLTNEVIAQADGPPVAGWYPTSWWTSGETIADERTFDLSPDVTPGAYSLVIGFYDLVTGQRWGDEYQLGTVEVVAPASN
ncbi:MAG: hypothetical protein H6658_12705 [Ardenticatenaceae bacterium]|nr:hypothetical protein [Ardenticatenaceae bacterium]